VNHCDKGPIHESSCHYRKSVIIYTRSSWSSDKWDHCLW